MFQVDIAPDALCELKHLVLQQLENGGKAEAMKFVDAFEAFVAGLREDPYTGSGHMKGIPAKYRIKNVVPRIALVYQVREDIASVKIDGVVADQNGEP